MWLWWRENNRSMGVVYSFTIPEAVLKKKECARKIAPSTSAQFYFESIIDSSSTNQMGIEPARLARQAYCSYCIRETLISIPIPN